VVLRNKKQKGTQAERELIHKFWEVGFASIRVAGSGSSKYPSPDILAGNSVKKIALEIKVINQTKKYFSKKEILELEEFSKKFGCESWVGVRFVGNQWFFMPTFELKQTDANFSIDLINMKRKGFTFEEMID
jgi:holliday junction resolvase Hjr